MSPEEPVAFPAPNRYPDTPESLQECLELKDHIDTLLAMWKYSAHHPSATPLRIAELIQDDCGPVEEIAEDYQANTGFGGKYTHDQADYLADRDAARRALVDILNDSRLDELSIQDDIIASYIDLLETYGHNPMAPDAYKEAVLKLRRIIILREQVTHTSRSTRVQAREAEKYIDIIKGLANALV